MEKSPKAFEAVKAEKMSLHEAENAIEQPANTSVLDHEGHGVPRDQALFFDASIKRFAAMYKGLKAAIVGLNELLGTQAGEELGDEDAISASAIPSIH
jgi:hypothetical protein